MKNFTFIPVILLSLTSVNALADGYICKSITGAIPVLVSDPGCNILKEKSNHFPDVTFYGAQGTCFSGSLNAMLGGNTSVTGTFYSGLTVNGLGQSTVASAIRLNAGSIELGRVFTKDVIFPYGDTTELLTMVGGSKMFNGGYGAIEITGNVLADQTSSFTGKLCIQY